MFNLFNKKPTQELLNDIRNSTMIVTDTEIGLIQPIQQFTYSVYYKNGKMSCFNGSYRADIFQLECDFISYEKAEEWANNHCLNSSYDYRDIVILGVPIRK